MSIRLMSAAFSADLPDVEIETGKESIPGTHTVKASTSKFVLLALADHANDEGRGAYPSLDTLAHKTSMSRRTVQRAIDALKILGIIKLVGISEYGTDNYSIFESAISRGDSGTNPQQGVTLVQEGDDSGALKSVPESPESSFKPSINTTTREKIAEVFKAYESEIGLLTPHSRDCINDYLDHLKISPDWIIEAIHIAREQQKANWAYCAAILKRWSQFGKNDLPPKPRPYGPKYPNKGDNTEFFRNLAIAAQEKS
jgi:DnaD/phage-associated family protein